MADVWARSTACHPRAICHTAGCCHRANSMTSFQSHVSHCRVLPLGEFTVTIPEPHATLQGAVTWWNQCHDHATLQGVIIPSAILKIVFRHISLFVFNAVRLWQVAAFVSSPIYLFSQLRCATFSFNVGDSISLDLEINSLLATLLALFMCEFL